jgi:hypothetical protein
MYSCVCAAVRLGGMCISPYAQPGFDTFEQKQREQAATKASSKSSNVTGQAAYKFGVTWLR